MRPIVISLLLVAFLAAGFPAPGLAAPAELTATATYQKIFGPPPTVAKGTCYAMVGYLPLVSDSARVRPFPLFAFRRSGQLELLVGKLIKFDRRIADRIGVMVPFPEGTQLQEIKHRGSELRIYLQVPSDREGDPAGMARSLANSAAQFAPKSRLQLYLNGKPVTVPASTVADPGPPLLLAARLGTAEDKAAQPELGFLFDRPVQVEHITLRGSGGEIPGERFLGVFDMAVVVHPPIPAAVKLGDLVTAQWAVTDRLGRTGEGSQEFPVEAATEP